VTLGVQGSLGTCFLAAAGTAGRGAAAGKASGLVKLCRAGAAICHMESPVC
jgi:hypothetical protein